MSRLDELKTHLKRGQVYRRDEFKVWSKSVDRHLEQLTEDGTLEKLSQGLYYFPKLSAFGKTPFEALAEVQKAKKAWLEAARAEGKPIPEPTYRPAIYQTAS